MAKTGNSTQLYSIAELEGDSGVPRRTIHYYVKEGLLPPPNGRGPNARYREEHLLKLVLIRLLKASVPLRLEGIRELIAPMGARELRSEIRKLGGLAPTRLEGPDAGMVKATESTTDYAAVFGFDDARPAVEKGKPPHLAVSAIRRALAEAATSARSRSESGAMIRGSGDSDLAGDIWFRVRISDGVEIHHRGGAGDFAEKIDKLVACARHIFRR